MFAAPASPPVPDFESALGPAGIPEADWLATPGSVRSLIHAQQQEIEQLRAQLTAMASELSELRERIGRSSRNSSKPPSSDGAGFKPPERRKGSGRKRGAQPGHPGSGPELLPIEQVDEVVEHHPDACRRCGSLLEGEDPDRLRHQVIEIPPITSLVIEHLLHQLVCPCCSTSTCATLPADVEASHYGPRLSALVGLLCSAFPLSFSKTQALLDQLLGVEISKVMIATIRQHFREVLEQPIQEALACARQQPVAYVNKLAPTPATPTATIPRKAWLAVGHGQRCGDGVHPGPESIDSRRHRAAGQQLDGGIVVSDRFSAYNHLPTQQRQLCWAHLIRDLVAIAERLGASDEFRAQLLGLERQLFDQWYQGRTDQSTDPPCNNGAGRSVRRLRRICSGWWSWATHTVSEHRGPAQCAPSSSS